MHMAAISIAALTLFGLQACTNRSEANHSDRSAQTGDDVGKMRPESEWDGQRSYDGLQLKGGGGGGSSTTTTKTRTYTSYFSGSATNVSPVTAGGLLLVGGSTDRDDAMQWFVDRAGRGDIVVLSVGGTGGYNPYIMAMGADSVESISFSSAKASIDPAIASKIRNAEGVFLSGGDQSLYVNYWKDTPIEAEINAVAARGGVVGGTSAGLAVLGEFLYPAFNASAVSSTAMANPFDVNVMVDKDFLTMPRLSGLITDSHFGARDRMGRLITFMSRIVQGGWAATVRGVGVDESTAIGIDNLGIGKVFAGTGKAYFLSSTIAPAVCAPNTPLTFTGINTIRLSAGEEFNFNTWTTTGGTSYQLNVNAGVLTSSGSSIY